MYLSVLDVLNSHFVRLGFLPPVLLLLQTGSVLTIIFRKNPVNFQNLKVSRKHAAEQKLCM